MIDPLNFLELKMKIILTDIDGVVLDWEKEFHKWMESHGHVISENEEYDMALRYSISKELSKNQIVTFNESAVIGDIPAFRDARVFIPRLYDEFGYKFVAVTSMTRHPSAVKLRKRNLIEIFGKNIWHDFHFLDCGQDKDFILKNLAKEFPKSFWIEDKPANALAGKRVGLRPLLMKHPYSEGYDDQVPIVENWKAVYNIIRNYECSSEAKAV